VEKLIKIDKNHDFCKKKNLGERFHTHIIRDSPDPFAFVTLSRIVSSLLFTIFQRD
jgi:hypothetical protein